MSSRYSVRLLGCDQECCQPGRVFTESPSHNLTAQRSSFGDWTPGSWRGLLAAQQPEYSNVGHLGEALERIKKYPPLVAALEVDQLRERLAEAAQGKRFLLQGGDCAERFLDCRSEAIESKLRVLLQMSWVLGFGASRPVITVGRIAGQYMKPRSQAAETLGSEFLPIYRGDGVNDFAPNAAARAADPERLVRAYQHAGTTLNFIRSHLHQDALVESALRLSPETRSRRFELFFRRLADSRDWLQRVNGKRGDSLEMREFFASHEGLHLGFEEALTRWVPERKAFYNLGAHMLWLGDRTRTIDGAHVEYFRGIANPIGVKVGPTLAPDSLALLLRRLDPRGTPGRLTLITRLGADRVEALLPALIRAVEKTRLPVLWCCDPMHGNTLHLPSGYKTRRLSDMTRELFATVKTLRAHGLTLGGVHFEMTGDYVTECLGGDGELSEQDLAQNYETYCDPRLNGEQSLEMAFFLGDLLGQSGN